MSASERKMKRAARQIKRVEESRSSHNLALKKRIQSAQCRRDAARYVELGLLLSKATKRDKALARRAKYYAQKSTSSARSVKFATRRALQDKVRASCGEMNEKRIAAAIERRQVALTARISKAKKSASSRCSKNTMLPIGEDAHGFEKENNEEPVTVKDQADSSGILDKAFRLVFG